jgi:multiple antibiotic resistance protein
MFRNPKFVRSIGVIGILSWLLLVAFVGSAAAQRPVPPLHVNTAGNTNYPEAVNLGMVFTAFCLMLGPIKIFVPYVQVTAGLGEAEARRVARRAVVYACIIGIAAAFIGQRMLVSWGISLPALHLAAGVVLLLVALRNMVALYAPDRDVSKPATTPSNPALAPLAYPTILAPYGIAIFILFLAVSRDVVNDLFIFGLFLVVMILNWVSMRYAHAVVRRGGTLFAILGAVIGVLLVALSVQMILDALRYLQVLPSP